MNVVISHDQMLAVVDGGRLAFSPVVSPRISCCDGCGVRDIIQCGYFPCLGHERKDKRRGGWRRVYA